MKTLNVEEMVNSIDLNLKLEGLNIKKTVILKILDIETRYLLGNGFATEEK